MRIVISEPSTGKSYQAELSVVMETQISGKKIGDSIDGNLVGAPGYVLELKGGSDKSGFPMRPDISGPGRKSVLVSKGIGFNALNKGQRSRRNLRGNLYSFEIAQVNAAVKQAGQTPLEQLFPKKIDDKKEKK